VGNEGEGGLVVIGVRTGDQAFCWLAKWEPMWMTLSAMTPSPTHRFTPSSPLYRDRFNPCRPFRTLMRPSHPVRHFCSFLNQRCFCRCLRAGLLVAWLGIETQACSSLKAPTTPQLSIINCGGNMRRRDLLAGAAATDISGSF